MKSNSRSKLVTKVFAILWLAGSACVFLSAPAVLGGQLNGTLSGPILGYVFSAPEGRLRPLRGVLGSATVGDPVELDFGISQALALDARHFAASTDANPELLILNLETNPASAAAISGAPASPKHAAASVRGTSAAFYYAGSQGVLIVTGFPRNPTVSHFVDLSNSGGSLTHVAVSDDGALLVYSMADGDRESLYRWTPSSNSSRFVSPATSVGGIAITASGAAIVSDRGANEIFAIWDARNAAVPQFLIGEKDGVSSPAEVAVSADNRIYIANVGSATVMVLDLSGRLLRSQHCDCDVTGLYPLRDSVFRLTEGLDRTVYLLDASRTDDRISFVPPLRPNP